MGNRRDIITDQLKVWFDAEADFLEVRFSEAAGYEKETHHDAVMERVYATGRVIGWSILGVSKFGQGHPLEADLLNEGDGANSPAWDAPSGLGVDFGVRVVLARVGRGAACPYPAMGSSRWPWAAVPGGHERFFVRVGDSRGGAGALVCQPFFP